MQRHAGNVDLRRHWRRLWRWHGGALNQVKQSLVQLRWCVDVSHILCDDQLRRIVGAACEGEVFDVWVIHNAQQFGQLDGGGVYWHGATRLNSITQTHGFVSHEPLPLMDSHRCA